MILNFEVEQKYLGWFGDGIEVKQDERGRIIGYHRGRRIYGISGKDLEEFKNRFAERMRKQYSNFEWVE